MKKFLTVTFFFILTYSFSQGYAVYNMKYGEHLNKKYNFKSITTPEVKSKITSILKELNKDNANIQFELFFNKTESTFKYKDKLNIDDNSTPPTLYVSGTTGVFYNSWTKRLREVNSYGNLFLIEYELLDAEKWNLLTESKIINDINCYKATTSYKVNGENYLVEAWYAPSIPYQFGPKGFGNLPGLIFELSIVNRKKITFSLTDLDLKKKNIKIKKPKKGKVITKDDYDRIGKKLMERTKK